MSRVQLALDVGDLDVEVREETACCGAPQDEVWLRDPDGARSERHVVHDALDTPDGTPAQADPTMCRG